MCTEMDNLVLGSYMLDKPKQPPLRDDVEADQPVVTGSAGAKGFPKSQSAPWSWLTRSDRER